MINLKRYQADRFEERYGSILDVIKMFNVGKTYREVAKALSEKHPISVSQLQKYMSQFVEVKYHPVEYLEKYYFGRSKDKEFEQLKQVKHEMRILEQRDNIVYVDFSPSQKQA